MMSTPTPYQHNPSEQQFIQGILQNPPTPANPNSLYAMPQNINDVAGIRNAGFSDADTAARAAAKSLHDYTQQSGSEAGAWIVSKQVNGQDRFFVVAPSQGVQNTVDNQVALQDLNNFLQANPGDKYTIAAHIHSHPQQAMVQDNNNPHLPPRLAVIQEGVSRGDFISWGGNNSLISGMPNKGYIVSGDGDVYRLDFPDLTRLSPQQQGNMANGQFTAATMPTLSRIGDVDLKVDTPMTPNLWATATNGQPMTMLPQSQVVDTVKLLSDSTHPDHAMFTQAQRGLGALDPQRPGFRNPGELDNAAASLVYEAKKAGLGQIDTVALSRDGKSLFAIEGAATDPAALRTPAVDKAQAVAQSVENTSLRLLNDNPTFVPRPTAQTTSQTETLADPIAAAAGYSR
jgi:hypothetical protein